MLWIHPPGVLWLALVSAKMEGAATSFRRTSFVVQTKILYCETTITNKIPFWRQKLSQFVWKFVFQNKAKNSGRSGKNAGMREIRKNAGFPARLQDGWHLWTLSNTFVPADQQLRLGEHAVHGGDALTEWHVHRSGVQQLNIVLKASNSRLRYPWESPDRFGVSDSYRWQIDLTA